MRAKFGHLQYSLVLDSNGNFGIPVLRNFMRLITRYSTLYTEMVVDSTILHNTHHVEEYLGTTRDAVSSFPCPSFRYLLHAVVKQYVAQCSDVERTSVCVRRSHVGFDEIEHPIVCQLGTVMRPLHSFCLSHLS